MRRPRVVLAGAVALLAMLAGSLPGGADAASAPGDGSSRAQAAEVTPGAGMTVAPPTVTVLPGNGSVLSALTTTVNGVTSALTTNVTTPLVNSLAALPNQLTGALSAALVGSGFQAQNDGGQQPRPSSGYPTCGQRGWSSSNCFGPVTPNLTAPPAGPLPSLLTLNGGTVQGYATGDAKGYIAATRAANPVLSLLGFPLGDLGLISSSASCGTASSSCGATQSVSGGSLLQDQLKLSIADGGALVAKIGGVAVPQAGKTLTVAGFNTTVTTSGNLATIAVKLTLPQLLTALGLPNLLSSVVGLGVLSDNNSVATLTIKVGPGSVTQSPASAWGLEVSADLAVDVELKLVATVQLLGIIGLTTATIATVAVKTTGTAPSLLDLKLAYSTATAGNLPSGWVPPALV